jgi:hypothetical protein
MRASKIENARLITNRMKKMKDGKLVTLGGGKSELMSKRRIVHVCLRKVTIEHVFCLRSRKIEDRKVIKLEGEKDELELAIHKRDVNTSFEKQEIVRLRTFYHFYDQVKYFRFTCPCQIPAHEIIYDPEALSYFMRNMIFKGSNPVLTKLME